MGDAAIEVIDGWRSLDGRQVLSGVSCHFPAHRISAVVGPSACGKTVLLRHLVGLDRLDSGEVIAEGRPVSAMATSELLELRRRWGVQSEGPGALFSSMTVADNLAFPLRAILRLPERAVRQVVSERLDEVGLGHTAKRYPQQLSEGERVRAAFARAAAVQPRVLILDSPETGHDEESLAGFGRVIALTQERLECTLIMLTRSADLARRLAHHAVVMREGSVVAEGRPLDPPVRELLDGG